MNYTVYKLSSGEIRWSGACPERDFYLQGEEGDFVIEGLTNNSIQYVLNGVIVNKSENPAAIDKSTMLANSNDIVTISNLPNPTRVILNGISYMVTDSVFTFSVDTPGEYRIRCNSFPYLSKEFTIYAN